MKDLTKTLTKTKNILRGILGSDMEVDDYFGDYFIGYKLREKMRWLRNYALWYLNMPSKFCKAYRLAKSSGLYGSGRLKLIRHSLDSMHIMRGWF